MDLEEKIKQENNKIKKNIRAVKIAAILSAPKKKLMSIVNNQKERIEDYISKKNAKKQEKLAEKQFQESCEKKYQEFLKLYDESKIGTIEKIALEKKYVEIDSVVDPEGVYDDSIDFEGFKFIKRLPICAWPKEKTILYTEHGPFVETKQVYYQYSKWGSVLHDLVQTEYYGYILNPNTHQYEFVSTTFNYGNNCQLYQVKSFERDKKSCFNVSDSQIRKLCKSDYAYIKYASISRQFYYEEKQLLDEMKNVQNQDENVM